MSSDDQQPLENASEIIERFGGLRPMSGKINVPVTTIQGWKKRDVIPANRRDEVLAAAKDNGIDLSDIIDIENTVIANENGPVEKTAPAPVEKPAPVQEKPASFHATPERAATKPADMPEMPFTRSRPMTQSHEELMEEIHASSEKAVQTSIWATAVLLLIVVAVGGFLMWPSAKKLDEQRAKLDALEGELGELGDEVRDVNRRASFLKNMVPQEMQQKLDSMQDQARTLQTTVQQISQQAEDIQKTVFSAEAGSLSERLNKLEQQVVSLTGSEDIGNMVGRIRTLEQSVAGQAQLSGAMTELTGIVDSLDGKVGDLEGKLEEVKVTNAEGALGQTLGDVTGNDLKAAAMLLAFSKLRDSLNRQAPFEEDLALLQKMVGEDNPDLQDALTRLAPRANGGVLTPEGLSGEFKGLAGDIVVSSLKGEDVSIMDQAKARLGNVLKVEKGGEMVVGTETQIKVAKAQALLDEGNVEAAIAELQTLEGEAAQTAQPFVEEAQMTLLSQQVQGMLQTMIMSNIGGLGAKLPTLPGAGQMPAIDSMTLPTSLPPGQIDVESIKQNLQGAVPGQPEVIRDEESGLTILPRQQGFKGFSAGQQ